MKPSLVPGLRRVTRVTVDRHRTIGFLGETMRIYATPSMVADVENAALELIAEHLDPGESSVGIRIAVDHLAATLLGQWVEIAVEITALEGRKVSLTAEVRDALELVGRAEHVRFVIDLVRQAERLERKADRLRGLQDGSETVTAP